MRIFQILLFLLISSSTVTSQVCKPKLSVYFDYDSHTLNESESQKLTKLLSELDLKKEYIIQLIASTDSIADFSYNKILARKRGEIVKSFINKHNLNTKSIDIISQGETNPKYPNNDSIYRRLNRRTDIVVFPIDSGTITLIGDQGTEITISVDYFSPCSICETKPKVIEILNGEQAIEQGIPMLTTDGRELITGGMAKLNFDCPKPLDNPCLPATLKFPIQQDNEAPDSLMVQWESVPTPNGMRWRAKGTPCVPIGDILVSRIECFQKETQTVPKTNCDVPKCYDLIIAPTINRQPFKNKINKYQLKKDSNRIKSIGNCIDSLYKVYDIGIDSEGKVYTFFGVVGPYKDDSTGAFIIPLSSYSVSYTSGITLPILTRDIKPKIKLNNISNSYDLIKNHIKIDSTKLVTGNLIDEGYDTNNIKYNIDSNLEDFVSDKKPTNYSISYVVPLSAYSKTLFYHDSIYVVKSPKKLIGGTELLITPIDSSLSTNRFKGKRNTSQFKMPKHPTDLLFQLKKTKGNTNFITLSPNSDIIRRKYKKRKKYYKLKIKKSKLKKLINSENEK